MKDLVNLEDAKGKISEVRSLFYGGVVRWLYVAVAVPASVVAYKIIKALSEKGFFESFADTVSKAIDDVQYLAHKCPSLIHDFDQFTKCLGF